MHQICVNRFGPSEVLEQQQLETLEPGPGQVRVRLTSIGMNHADLMGRRGQYKASTGEPPYVPGIEGGGVIDAVGQGIDPARIDQRVSLGPHVPRGCHGPHGGTYRTHMVVDADVALPAPDCIADEHLGALWLAYLTSYGCLQWKANLQPGQIVGIPAASSSVGLAAAQVVKHLGATAIGLTSSPGKHDAIAALPNHGFDHLIITHDKDAQGNRTMRPWHREVRNLTDGQGVDVFFDPVGAGEYLSAEVRCLAQGGRVYIYGLLGEAGPVDLSPLIIRQAGIDGWVLYEIVQAGEDVWRPACEAIFGGFASGAFTLHVAETFKLSDVRQAHDQMELGRHIGKMILLP